MSRRMIMAATGALATALLAACSDSTGSTRASLTAVNPAPAATAVPATTPIVLTFGQAMMPGMEQYVDLHKGTVAGPTVPMGCGWNPAATVLTCLPTDSLSDGTVYTTHVGAGMTDAQGDMMDMSGWSAMGGQWATSGMMGGTHAGQPLAMMGSGWMHDGHYGMLFTFTTVSATPILASVSPAAAATGVASTAPITLTFSQPMMSGMEQYMDLHQGTIADPTVPMSCGWNTGRTVLTCTPTSPMASGTAFTIHVGAGMTDAHGDMMDMAGAIAMGGVWATSGMMGGTHAGQPIGMMGAGWMDGSGHYGMLFGFTTN